jgi:hypothetical protein
MAAIYPNRRIDFETFRHLNHALDLVRTHGWRYAVMYLRNQRIAESTLQRVLFGEWSRRRNSGNRLVIFNRAVCSAY